MLHFRDLGDPMRVQDGKDKTRPILVLKKHLYLAALLICLFGNINAQTHRVPLGAALPEEYMRPDGGL